MAELIFRDAGAIRAVEEDGKRRLEVLAAPFGSPSRKDKLNQFLSKNTDFMLQVGDKRPLLYMHGFTPRKRAMAQPRAMGVAEATRVDSSGLWMLATVPGAGQDELADRTWDAALEGRARASTGSVNYLERHDDTTGEVLCWPIAELSIFDVGEDRAPVSDDAVVIPLRALFDEHDINLPEGFEAGEDKDPGADNQSNLSLRGVNMNEIEKAVQEALAAERAKAAEEAEKEEAMRAKILKEIEGDPKYRSTFNTNFIDDSAAKKDEATEENFAYMRALIEDAKRVAAGGLPAMRGALEESEALEIGPMVPTDMANKIHEIRGKYSLVRRSGMYTYETDKLTFSIPTQTSAMSVLPTVAEEGAYVENHPAMVSNTVTMLKKGSLVTVTEEALEDQDLFQQFLVREAGKALALAENAVLASLLQSIDGVEVATQHTITDSEVLANYFALPQEYRDEAVYIMNDATLAYLRAMLIATPRAYGEIGFEFNGGLGVPGERFLSKPVFTNSNWASIASASDDEKVIDFVNLSEAIAWVDRRGLQIFVDPYSTRASAGTINFLPSARFNGVVVYSGACAGIDDHS